MIRDGAGGWWSEPPHIEADWDGVHITEGELTHVDQVSVDPDAEALEAWSEGLADDADMARLRRYWNRSN